MPSRWVPAQLWLVRGLLLPTFSRVLPLASPSPSFHPQMQVLLAQVQNSEQLLRTLQGTVSQAQERVQLQMVRVGPGERGV